MPVINNITDVQNWADDITTAIAALFASQRNNTQQMNYYLIDKMRKEFTGPISPSMADFDVDFVMGPPGPEGRAIVGPQGPRGYPGAGFNIVGTVDTFGDLPASSDMGDAIFVRSYNGHNNVLFIWAGLPDGWVDTTFEGPQGIQGIEGPAGPPGPFYTPYLQQTDVDKISILFRAPGEPDVGPVTMTLPVGPAGPQGPSGSAPYIYNGFWYVGGNNTNTPAQGYTPVIGQNGNWFINNVDTGYSARGVQGYQGIQGDTWTPEITSLADNIISITWHSPGHSDIGPVALVAPKGDKGDQGIQGIQGIQGPQGGYYVPNLHVGPTPDTASIGFSPSQPDLPAVNTITITAPQGIQGIQGIQGGYYQPVVTSLTTYSASIGFNPVNINSPTPINPVTIEGPVGPQGEQGPQGIRGNDPADLEEGFGITISESGDIPPRTILSLSQDVQNTISTSSAITTVVNQKQLMTDLQDFVASPTTVTAQKVVWQPPQTNNTPTFSTLTLPVVTQTYAGIVDAEMFRAWQQNQQDIEFLKLQSDSNHRTAVVAVNIIGASQSDLTDYFLDHFPGQPPQPTDRIISTGDNGQYIFNNNSQWVSITTSNLALTSLLGPGLTKHSNDDGSIGYNVPGIGQVNGWDSVKSRIGLNEQAITQLKAIEYGSMLLNTITSNIGGDGFSSIAFEITRTDGGSFSQVNTEYAYVSYNGVAPNNKPIQIPNQILKLDDTNKCIVIIDNIIYYTSLTPNNSGAVIDFTGGLTMVGGSGSGGSGVITRAVYGTNQCIWLAYNPTANSIQSTVNLDATFLLTAQRASQAQAQQQISLIRVCWFNGASSPSFYRFDIQTSTEAGFTPICSYNNVPNASGFAIGIQGNSGERRSISLQLLSDTTFDNAKNSNTIINPMDTDISYLAKFSLTRYTPEVGNNMSSTSTPANGTNLWPGFVTTNNINQNVNGVKTFSSFPVTPSTQPSTDYQVANKQYVDQMASAPQGPNPATNANVTSWSIPNGTTLNGYMPSSGFTVTSPGWYRVLLNFTNQIPSGSANYIRLLMCQQINNNYNYSETLTTTEGINQQSYLTTEWCWIPSGVTLSFFLAGYSSGNAGGSPLVTQNASMSISLQRCSSVSQMDEWINFPITLRSTTGTVGAVTYGATTAANALTLAAGNYARFNPYARILQMKFTQLNKPLYWTSSGWAGGIIVPVLQLSVPTAYRNYFPSTTQTIRGEWECLKSSGPNATGAAGVGSVFRAQLDIDMNQVISTGYINVNIIFQNATWPGMPTTVTSTDQNTTLYTDFIGWTASA